MLAKGVDQARFAEARLARQQHELAPARARRAPAIKQEGQLLITADEAKLSIAIRRCEAAFGSCLAEHAPHAGCLRKPFQIVTAKIFEREGSSQHMSSGVRDRHPGCRRGWSRPGNAGAATTTASSRAAPLPIRSPTTVSPVAIPMRVCSRVPGCGTKLRTTSIIWMPARTARSAESSWAFGYPK